MGKKNKNKGGEDGGWQNVGGKKSAKASTANNMQGSDSQVLTSGPLKTQPTMYQKAEEVAQQKAERRADQGKPSSSNTSTQKETSSKSQPKKKKSKGKSQSGSKGPSLRERMENLDSDALLAVVTKAKDTFPTKQDEWMRALAGEIIYRVKGPVTGKVPEDLYADAPFCYASESVTTMLTKMFMESQPRLLAHFFAEFVKQLVDIGLQGQVDDKPGLQFLIQLFVRLEKKLNIDITLASLQPLFKHFRDRFPEDKVTAPVIWAISQTAAISPTVYLFAWKYLMLSVLMDKASPAIKDMAVKYLPIALKQGTPTETLNVIMSHRLLQPRADSKVAHLLTPPEFAKLMKLIFVANPPVSQQQHQILLAAYPYFREISLQQSPYMQFAHQFQYAAIPVTEQTWLSQVLLYLNVAMARDSRCFDLLIKQQKAGDINRVMRVLHYGVRSCRRGSDSPFLRHPKEFGDTAAALKLINNQFRSGKLTPPEMPKPKNAKKSKKKAEEEEEAVPSWLDVHKPLLDQSDAVCDSIKTVLRDSQGDSLWPLWIALLISLGLFMVLGSHLYCRFYGQAADVRFGQQCASLEDTGLLEGIDTLYEGLAPYIDAATPYYVKARDTAQPYIDPVVEAATPYVNQAKETIGPYASQAYETVEPHVSAAIESAGPYAAAAKEAATPYVEKSGEAIGDFLAAAGPYFQTLSDVSVEYFEKATDFISQAIRGESRPTASAPA